MLAAKEPFPTYRCAWSGPDIENLHGVYRFSSASYIGNLSPRMIVETMSLLRKQAF
jgi:hypothetical protein